MNGYERRLVTYKDIGSGQIRSGHLDQGAVLPGTLASGAVQSGNIGAGAILPGNIASGAVQSGNIGSEWKYR